MDSSSKVAIGLTTLPTHEAALKLAHELISSRLAFCVQIGSPITSFYEWENKIESSTEFRLVIKFLSTNAKKLENFIHKNHPYEVPQWLIIPVSYVGTPYLKWAEEVSIFSR